MRMAKISELRDGLSRYIEYVRTGGRVLIMDRNRPVAEIVPLEASGRARGATDEARLDALQRQGLIRRGTGRIPSEALRGTGPAGGSRVLEALLDERASGR